MKKIMILMLSLAVLFSFAACDNSSNTPDTSDETVGLSDYEIKNVASQISKLLQSGKTSDLGAIDAILQTSNLLDSANEYAPVKGITIADDYTSITKTITLEDGIEGFSANTEVVFTVNGVDKNPTTTKGGTKTIALETYTYKFSTAAPDANGNNVVLSGELSGYSVGGSVAVTLDATGKATSIIVTNPTTVLLPETVTKISAKLGDETVDATKLLGILNADSNLTTAKSYESYRDSLISEGANCYMNDVNTYAMLLTGNENSIFAKLVALVTAQSSTQGFSTSYTGTNTSGSAEIKYTIPAEGAAVPLAGAGTTNAGDKQLSLAAGDPLTVKLYSADNTSSTNEFVAARFEITGTFQVAAYAGEEPDFDEVVVTLSGKLDTTANQVKVTNNNGAIGTLTATQVTASAYTGSAAADIAVGPALIQSGDNVGTPVVETVTVEYPYTPAV